jgi:hypothetical protein
MKKVILGLSGFVILVFVVVLFTNAQNSQQEVKKAGTEMSKDCGKCPSASACGKMAETKTCDPAKCKELGYDPAKCKEGKSNPANCKAISAKAVGETKKCCPATGRETAQK